uniref:THAP-type domain-containing protein n=1 Tax=Zeugodacus cucurbitae TaxID=28588 RepID=A0A0A1XH65_ZEUCU
MPLRRCFAGCPLRSAVLYPFPPKTDVARRDLWIRQFGKVPEQFPQKNLYVCRRHFTSRMTFSRLLRKNAYPDVNLSPYNKDEPYTELYSYYKSDGKPDPLLHDNFCDEWLLPPEDCDLELEFASITHILPISEERAHSEDNASDTTQSADEQEEPPPMEEKPVKYKRKRKCILQCVGRRSLHILPSIETELERREKWLYLLGKDPALYTEKRIFVCDQHFDIHMIGLSKLIRGAYPNKNLPPPLIKSIPEKLEAHTACVQKCTDYRRKYQFPMKDAKMRETWLQKFGRSPELYKHNLYACDRHFSEEMRVGPYLQAHAIPDQNLELQTQQQYTTSSDVCKNWSLQRLDALTFEVTISTTTTTQTPTATTTKMPTATTTIMLSPNGTSTTMFSPTSATTTMISPPLPIKIMHSPPQISPQTPTFDQTTHDSNIPYQTEVTVAPTASQNPPKSVDYVKIRSLGVFLQHKDGYVVSMKQILEATDPLDCNKYQPSVWTEPIEPKLNIKVHPIPKEIYEGYDELSEDETSRSASPMDMDYTVEESSDWYAPVYNIKRNDSGYTTVEMSKFTHTADEQQNNSEFWGREDSYDNCKNTEDGPIYNIKRRNFDYDYATAKKVKFSVPQNVEELWGREDNYEYHKNDSANTAVLSNFSGDDVNEAGAGNAVMEDPVLDHLVESYPTENISVLLGRKNKVVKYKTVGASKDDGDDDDLIIPDEPLDTDKVSTQKKAVTFNKHVITVQRKQPPNRTNFNKNVITAQPKPLQQQQQHNTTNFNKTVITAQPQQQQQNTNALTKAVALAESWQQVVQTMQQVPSINVTTTGVSNNTQQQQQPDAFALAARKLVEQIKQAGEREKLNIQQNGIAGNLMAAGNKQIMRQIANTTTTTKIVNKDNPNAFRITNVEIINPKQSLISGKPAALDDTKRAKITNVRIINSKQATTAANGNKVRFSDMGTQQTQKNRKEIMQKMINSAATNSTRTAATNTTTFEDYLALTHKKTASRHNTIDDLLAKAKRIIKAKNTEKPKNNNKSTLCNTQDDVEDELPQQPEAAKSLAPTTTTHVIADNVATAPSCVLECAHFRKLYEFPTPDEQTLQRHFWFIQLGLDIASGWRKNLFICEKHFDDTMLLPPDNTLNEYAYPCQSLMRQLNKPTATVGTQTCDDAVQYKQRLFDQLELLQDAVRKQRLEMKRVQVLIRLKQEAVRLVAEIEEEKNAPKLLTIRDKK